MEDDDDNAHNTMHNGGTSSEKGWDDIVSAMDTITDLGTLVIIDDPGGRG